MQCVILAGGLATRMRPLTGTIPKVLLPVRGRPFADIQLHWLAAGGVTEVVYCVGFLGDQVRAYVGDGSAWGVSVRYSDEGDDLRGTGGALRLALDGDLLADAFLVLYGDSYLTCDLGAVWADFAARRPPALMTVFHNAGRFDRSNVATADGRVLRYDKTSPDPVADGLESIDYGLSVLDRAVVSEIPPGDRVDLADVYGRLAADGRLAAFTVTERFYEIGSPAGLNELEELLA